MSRPAYTRELLERTAAQSTSLADMLRRLDALPGSRPPGGRRPRGYLRRRLTHYGIDTSHFTGTRGYCPGLIPRAECEAAVAGAVSLGGALRRLGIPDSGAARARLRRSLEAHGIGTGHFTGRAYARGSVSPRRLTPEQILRRGEGAARRTKTALLRRALDELGVPRACAACGVGEVWQGRRLVLEVDHVNGDRADNRRENLRYLCPSCHSQTRSYASRSRRGRPAGDPVE
jgi:hypothetical protein